MLDSGEKDGALALLQMIELSDLIPLAKTVTNNQISVTNKEDAVRAIITYSKNGVELLKRNKLKRAYLFQYLAKVNVVADPRAGKVQLAKAVLDHWGTHNVDILDLMEIGDDMPPNQDGNQAVQPANQQATGGFQANHNAQAPPNTYMPLPNLIQDIPNANPMMHAQAAPGGAGESWIADFMSFEHSVQSTAQEAQMGQEFAKWFYQMLNACHPQGLPCTTSFGTQHFFPECQLKLAILNNNELDVHQGADAVCHKFLHLSQGEQLLFNPNVDVGGVMGFATPHGLKIFLVCGTLHKDGDIVGIFAQQFGLIRNPDRDFNWNIKFTNLKLIAGKPTAPPTLQNPGTMQPLSGQAGSQGMILPRH